MHGMDHVSAMDLLEIGKFGKFIGSYGYTAKGHQC